MRDLIDSGATRCFISPKCMQVAGLHGKRSDAFLELGNDQRIFLRCHVPDIPVTLARHTSCVDLTVTNLLHDANLISGMTWLESLRPLIDWVSGEIDMPHNVSTYLIQGEWLQEVVETSTIIVLYSHEKIQEIKNDGMREGLSIKRFFQFRQHREIVRDCGQSRLPGEANTVLY